MLWKKFFLKFSIREKFQGFIYLKFFFKLWLTAQQNQKFKNLKLLEYLICN